MLKIIGTWLLLGLVWCGGAWAQGSHGSVHTHTELVNDLDFTVANGRWLSGVYECAEGGYIDASCLVGIAGPAGDPGNIQINGGGNTFGVFPGTSCPAGYAIQALDVNGTPPSCISVGGLPAGSDTWVQYNNAGAFGADQNFTWNFSTVTLNLGAAAATTGFQTFGGGLLASLGTPADGTITYCTNCNVGSDPCTSGGTGAIAQRLNGRWFCSGAGSGGGSVTGTGTLNHLAKWTSSSAIGDSVAVENGTTLTVGAVDLSYSQALYITGLRSISTSVAADSTDRIVLCTSGSSTDKTYTLPAATGSGRTLDLVKVDTGTNACKITVPSGALNAGTTATLPTVWNAETCIDIGSGQWSCRGVGTIS